MFTLTLIIHSRRTALHSSIVEENQPLFDLLIDTPGINFDVTTKEGYTTLCFALNRETLLEYYAEKLLSRGAMPNPTCTYSGDTLLHILARDGREAAALFLVEYPLNNLSNQNTEGYTILHEACTAGLENLTRALVKRHVSTNVFTKSDGKAPIHLAILKQHYGVVMALLEAEDAESQLNLKDGEGETPLSLAIKAPLKKGREIVAALIKAGADINQCNEKGLTLLHQAILKEDSATAIFLLENGADMNAK